MPGLPGPSSPQGTRTSLQGLDRPASASLVMPWSHRSLQLEVDTGHPQERRRVPWVGTQCLLELVRCHRQVAFRIGDGAEVHQRRRVRGPRSCSWRNSRAALSATNLAYSTPSELRSFALPDCRDSSACSRASCGARYRSRTPRRSFSAAVFAASACTAPTEGLSPEMRPLKALPRLAHRPEAGSRCCAMLAPLSGAFPPGCEELLPHEGDLDRPQRPSPRSMKSSVRSKSRAASRACMSRRNAAKMCPGTVTNAAGMSCDSRSAQ